MRAQSLALIGFLLSSASPVDLLSQCVYHIQLFNLFSPATFDLGQPRISPLNDSCEMMVLPSASYAGGPRPPHSHRPRSTSRVAFNVAPLSVPYSPHISIMSSTRSIRRWSNSARCRSDSVTSAGIVARGRSQAFGRQRSRFRPKAKRCYNATLEPIQHAT